MPPIRTLRRLLGAAMVALTLLPRAGGLAQEPPAAAAPEARGREAFVRVCAKCHTAERVTAQARSRAQWEEVMIAMRTGRGAVFSDDEFATILEYLVRAHSPESLAGAGPPPTPAGRANIAAGGRGPRAHVGAADRHRVDLAAARRGQTTYAAECVTCHGTAARGGDDPATNLVRSSLMLRDRYGSAIAPFLAKGHPLQTGRASTTLSAAEITDLSHFIWDRINDTLQGSPAYEPADILTGDPSAGRAYFEGEGRCATCHSPSGDLAAYGRKFSPVDIQQRFVFPAANAGRGGGPARKPVTVTVTVPGASPVAGTLVSVDDFHVALKDATGRYRSWRRTADMTIVTSDPYAAHVALLERLSDDTMHDVVAYLHTLK